MGARLRNPVCAVANTSADASSTLAASATLLRIPSVIQNSRGPELLRPPGVFTSARLSPGDRVLVQGAGGGVATAAVLLGAAAGLEVVVTSRDEDKRRRALSLGAVAAVETGARLPFRVDAVLETVGAATWAHSIRALRPGGTVVVAGATSGDQPGAELTRMFFTELSVVGATMGSKDDLEALALASEKLQRSIAGAPVKKVIVVPDRLVNVVA